MSRPKTRIKHLYSYARSKYYYGVRDFGGNPRGYCKECKLSRYFVDGKCKVCGWFDKKRQADI